MKVVSAAPLVPRSSLSTWTMSSWPSVERILDARAADVDAVLEIGARDFLEGEETVPLAAVIDEGSFEARFDAGDDTLVDIAFALLFACGFDIEVEQLLAIDDRDAQLFRLASR